MPETTNRQVTLGVVLIFLGIFLLLNQLNVVFLPWYIFTWQFILIAVGTLLIITKDKWEPGLILVTIGSAFLIGDVFHISFREMIRYWPVILILIGVITLIKNLNGMPRREKGGDHHG